MSLAKCQKPSAHKMLTQLLVCDITKVTSCNWLPLIIMCLDTLHEECSSQRPMSSAIFSAINLDGSHNVTDVCLAFFLPCLSTRLLLISLQTTVDIDFYFIMILSKETSYTQNQKTNYRKTLG